MIVIVNGKEKKLKAGATLKEALKGEHYVAGTLVSVHLSTEKLVKESDDFEIVTTRGDIVIHLDDSDDGNKWKSMIADMKGLTLRWATEKISAFGSFSTDIKVDRSDRMYRRYDCFFSLGGFDNNTTYLMIAKDDHRWAYGAGNGRVGRITRGRHVIDMFKEGDEIIDIRPVTSEESTENVIVTKDLSYKLEDGYKVDSHVCIELNEDAPQTAEHILILAGKGHMHISDATGSYAACSDDKDVTIPDEPKVVREIATVSVRNQGEGLGRVFFYKERRQLSQSHNYAGHVIGGMAIASLAETDDDISVTTVPQRLLSVGMTQAEAGEFLASRGVKQKRTGDLSDDAIVVEQKPERTIDALKAGLVETMAVKKDKIYRISLDRKTSPVTIHYFEKVTGLTHKSIGSMTVHFTFEGLPMITFVGDTSRAHTLYPNEPFKKCKRGDIGVTNQAMSNAGLLGIRLVDSKDYGPTGEEGYGTNIFGKFIDDLDKFMDGLEDGSVVYITEDKL